MKHVARVDLRLLAFGGHGVPNARPSNSRGIRTAVAAGAASLVPAGTARACDPAGRERARRPSSRRRLRASGAGTKPNHPSGQAARRGGGEPCSTGGQPGRSHAGRDRPGPTVTNCGRPTGAGVDGQPEAARLWQTRGGDAPGRRGVGRCPSGIARDGAGANRGREADLLPALFRSAGHPNHGGGFGAA